MIYVNAISSFFKIKFALVNVYIKFHEACLCGFEKNALDKSVVHPVSNDAFFNCSHEHSQRGVRGVNDRPILTKSKIINIFCSVFEIATF